MCDVSIKCKDEIHDYLAYPVVLSWVFDGNIFYVNSYWILKELDYI